MLAPMEAQDIVLERAGDEVVVAVLEGEHDIYTAPALRERLYEVVENGSSLVIDLTGAAFIDSSVLGVLLGARRRAHEAGHGFAVVCDEGSEAGVRRVLDVTGLIPVLPVVGDREAGLQTARSGPAKE
jgi:anti-sigma B factor antagonist